MAPKDANPQNQAITTAPTALDKAILEELRTRLGPALDGVAQSLGVSLRLGRGTFSPSNATFKLEVAVLTPDGDAITREAETYKQAAQLYDLDPEWLGKEFESNGELFKVTGLNTRSGKFPVLGKSVRDGRGMKFGAVGVQMAFLRAAGKTKPHIHLAVKLPYDESAHIQLDKAFPGPAEAAKAMAEMTANFDKGEKDAKALGLPRTSVITFLGCTCPKGA